MADVIGKSPPLIIFGVEPKDGSACPTLDPNASIQISPTLIGIYQSRIDAMINQLGKNMLLEFAPVEVPCPNCEFDAVAKRSTGIYKAGGPTPFDRGRRCPHCSGAGTLKTQETRCVKCLTKWNPDDYRKHGVAVEDPNSIVRTKGFLTDAPYFAKSQTAIVNHDISNILKTRVRRLRGPIPVGLREDRYCITFWQLVE